MIKRLFSQPLFVIGFLIITAMVTTSVVYHVAYDNVIPQDRYLYAEDGKTLISAAPLPPSKDIWFGTDRNGFHMLHKVIIGAKFTILAAIAIAFLRVVIAIPFGVLLSSYLKKYRRYMNGFVDSFHYIPLSLIAYYMLYPVLFMPPGGFVHTLSERIIIEVVVITVLTLPVLSVLISNESSELMKKEFIISSMTLGGSKRHIIWRHILPSMKEKFVIMFGQQVVQVLLIFSHLGLLKLFFGGTIVSRDPMFADPPASFTMEWSGLIGDAQHDLYSTIWIPLTPIVCIAITIYAVNLMVEGFTKASTGESRKKVKKAKINSESKTMNDSIVSDSFELQQNQSKAM